MRKLLRGRKTFIVGTLAMIFGLWRYSIGAMTANELAMIIQTSLLGSTIRMGIDSATNKAVQRISHLRDDEDVV